MNIEFINFISDRVDPNYNTDLREAEFILSNGKKQVKSILGGLPDKEEDAIKIILSRGEELYNKGLPYSESEPKYSGSIAEKNKGLKLDLSKIESATTFIELKAALKESAQKQEVKADVK